MYSLIVQFEMPINFQKDLVWKRLGRFKFDFWLGQTKIIKIDIIRFLD